MKTMMLMLGLVFGIAFVPLAQAKPARAPKVPEMAIITVVDAVTKKGIQGAHMAIIYKDGTDWTTSKGTDSSGRWARPRTKTVGTLLVAHPAYAGLVVKKFILSEDRTMELTPGKCSVIPPTYDERLAVVFSLDRCAVQIAQKGTRGRMTSNGKLFMFVPGKPQGKPLPQPVTLKEGATYTVSAPGLRVKADRTGFEPGGADIVINFTVLWYGGYHKTIIEYEVVVPQEPLPKK